MKPTPTLPQSVIDFAEFLNEPPQYEDLRMVRDYRHEAWARFEKVISDLSAALSVPAAEVVGEPVAYRWSFDGGDTWNYGTLKPGKMRFGDPDIIEPLYAAPPALGGKP